MTSEAPVAAIPAAVVILVRDGAAGLEVLVTERPSRMGFAGGALVFPGGKVDPEDHWLGAAMASHCAAIRELFEECGVLLAWRAGDGGAAAQSDTAGLAALPPVPFHRRLTDAGLEPATDRLVRFAHWVTPRDRPKRFDTQFFMALAPDGQVEAHDRHEVAEARWVRPPDALAEAAGSPLVVATHMILMKLSRWTSAAAAIEETRRHPVVTIRPERVDSPRGPVIHFPAEANYGVTEMAASLFRRS